MTAESSPGTRYNDGVAGAQYEEKDLIVLIHDGADGVITLEISQRQYTAGDGRRRILLMISPATGLRIKRGRTAFRGEQPIADKWADRREGGF